MVKRVASAPYFCIIASGSGELPSDFDIFRPWPSRTMLVKYTCENVLVLPPAVAGRRIERHHQLVSAIPHRDAVPPPQLPRDAPVADVGQPVEVDLLPSRRIE